MVEHLTNNHNFEGSNPTSYPDREKWQKNNFWLGFGVNPKTNYLWQYHNKYSKMMFLDLNQVYY